MERYVSLFLMVFVVQSATGLVELDTSNFDKIIKKFKASLVKFDVAFPYGDKQEVFVNLAKETKDSDDLLLAHVGVKDYGEKENEDLAKRYNVNKDDFPAVKLFLQGKEEPIDFDPKRDFTAEEFRKFVREKASVYLSLPGCVQELDKIAMTFMKASAKERQNSLNEAEAVVDLAVDDKNKASGKFYLTVMKKIIEKGNVFIGSETERLNKLLTGKLSDEKKTELNTRLNILQTFNLHEGKVKEDL